MAGTTINPYRFGGQSGYRRDGTNRSYVRARHLDTSRGRWISRDPIGLDGGDRNLYRYVGNCPVNLSDGSGLQGEVSLCAIPYPGNAGACSAAEVNNIAKCTKVCAQKQEINPKCYKNKYYVANVCFTAHCCQCEKKQQRDTYCCIGQCTSRGDDPPCGQIWYAFSCSGDLAAAKKAAHDASCFLASQGGRCHPGHSPQFKFKCFKKGKEIK